MTLTNESLIEAWLGVVDHVKAADFAPLDDADLKNEPACLESIVWAGCFFNPAANPYRKDDAVRHSYHLSRPDTYDFLRHEYTCREIEVLVTECANFCCVRARRPATRVLETPDKRGFIATVAEELLNMDDKQRPWSFQFPENLSEGSLFSTDPTAEIYSLAGWRARADGLIHHGQIHFLCYRKMQQKIGFRDDQAWFSEDFRGRQGAHLSPPPDSGDDSASIDATPQTVGEEEHRCPNCGTSNPPNSRYCSQCGSWLGS